MGSDKPKKSCYHCTKRRIVCDLTEPTCLKCGKKGLECPGYGVRYRFADGKSTTTTTPTSGSLSADGPDPVLTGASKRRQNNLKWVDVSSQTKRRRATEGTDTGSGPNELSGSPGLVLDVVQHRPSTGLTEASLPDDRLVHPSAAALPSENRNKTLSMDRSCNGGLSTIPDDDESVIEISRSDCSVGTQLPDFSAMTINLPPLLCSADRRTRLLFNHFMIMYDDEANGYRNQILPIAHSNPIIERAVCVAAAFHLSSRMPELRLPAESGRAAVISKLTQLSTDLGDTAWATILLMIVADLVTGHEHVVTLYKILVSFLDARSQAMGQSGLSGNSPLGEFLYYQSRVISFFAYPILGESRAIADFPQALQDPLGSLEQFAPRRQQKFNFLVTTNELEASNLSLVDSRTQLYMDIVTKATDLYLLRVRITDQDHPTSMANSSDDIISSGQSTCNLISGQLAHIRYLFEQVDPSAPGSHTMVWPAFVAAAESRSIEDKTFFTAILRRIWDSTGYANVLKALDVLPEIWERQNRGDSWTSILPHLKTVIM